MIILSITEVGDQLVIVTDNESRPEFVYPSDKFSDYASLVREINKSISCEAARLAKKAARLGNVLNSFNGDK